MTPADFKVLRRRISSLTPEQKRTLASDLEAEAAHDGLPEPVRRRETELNRSRVCIQCGTHKAFRHGTSAGLMRFRCRSTSCGKTFHALTGTRLSRLRLKSKWTQFEECLRDGRTLQQSAECCGISYRTAFLWRHRFLDTERKQSSLASIVETGDADPSGSSMSDQAHREGRPE